MSEPDKNLPERKYRWPWFFWASVFLFIALAVLWVGLAVKKIELQRDLNAPLPNTAPMR